MRKLIYWLYTAAVIVSVIAWVAIWLVWKNGGDIRVFVWLAIACTVIMIAGLIYKHKCPHCGKFMQAEGKYCPHCGKEL